MTNSTQEIERDEAGYSRLFQDVVRKAYGMPPMTDGQCKEHIADDEKHRQKIKEIQRKQRCANSTLHNLILD